MDKPVNSKQEELVCPRCFKACGSKAGLTTHMNAMHLTLSPSQSEQADRYLQKREVSNG